TSFYQCFKEKKIEPILSLSRFPAAKHGPRRRAAFPKAKAPSRAVVGARKGGLFNPVLDLHLKARSSRPNKPKQGETFRLLLGPIPTPKMVSGDGLSRPVLVKSTGIGRINLAFLVQNWSCFGR
ncbi:hypothetical protein ES288_D10G276300v1, partial [Gossypium darwinii]